MRILVMQPNLWFRNGAAPVVVTQNIAKELKSRHDFFFLSICYLDKNMEEELFEENYKVASLALPRWLPIFSSKKLYSHIKEWKPDIIHLNQLRCELLAPFIKKKFPTIPIITTKHGFYEYYNPSKGFIYSLFRLKAMKYVHKYIDHVVCISKFESLFYISHGIKKSRLSVIHNGINSATPPSMHLAKMNDVITVGKLEKRKGHVYFLDVASKIINQGVNQFTFKIYGDGPEYEKLFKRIKDFGCVNHVKLMGFESNQDKIYCEAAIYVHTATNEGFGLVIIEAMRYGLPVVAFAVDAIPEIVVDQITGFLVKAGDVEAMTEKVKILMENREIRLRMGNASRKRAEEMFSTKIMAECYEREYRNLLERHPSVA